jgi:dTDP-4-amino-4,6-dideoxygalactose transaminase
MQVPLLDLTRQYKKIKTEIDQAVHKVLEHTKFIMGPEVSEFEDLAADYCGSKYALGVASGTDALLIALRASGVKAGDEVITSTFSFFASAGVISRLGATPVFVDIDPDTYNLIPEEVKKAINDKTRVIMPVHIFGQCADMDSILKIAGDNDIVVVEDAAQAIGAKYREKKAGTMGDFGCFSFFPSKNLGAAGDAGLIISDFMDKQTFMKSLRDHGAHPKYYHSYIGYNSRLDTLQAAILSVKLKYLDEWTRARRKNAAFYNEAFKDVPVKTPLELEHNYHIYNQYTIATEKRDELLEHLRKNDVGCAIYYPLPLHAQECYKYLGYREEDYKNAPRASKEVLSIPVYPDLTDDERNYVVEIISAFFK